MAKQSNAFPSADGEVREYRPTQGTMRQNSVRFYYVNGIRTPGWAHREIATLVANIVQTPVTGIYNLSDGFGGDLGQCLGDSIHIALSQMKEPGFWRDRLTQAAIGQVSSVVPGGKSAGPALQAMREAKVAPKKIGPEGITLQQARDGLVRNPASLSLFDQLNAHLWQKQIVIAHSQGNLITSFALWALQALKGSDGLARIEIRSISSPAPAWPRGVNGRVKVYGQLDDLVTLFDPKNWTGNRSQGDWGVYFTKNPLSYVSSGTLDAHDVKYNMENTSLGRRLRADAGIAAF
jgi:hypothetical protein